MIELVVNSQDSIGRLLVSRCGSLAGIAAMSLTELQEIPSIGKAKAAALELGRRMMDVDDARVVFLDLLNWQLQKFLDFKGSAKGPKGPVSRTLKIKVNHQEGKVVFELANGPGQVFGKGAVKPTAEVAVLMDRTTARRVAAATLAYIRAWDVITFGDRRSSAAGAIRPQ